MDKVFGIGWAKTGTTTLGECLKLLGYNHQGQDLTLIQHLANGKLDPILEIARVKDSFEDWPWLLLFREFDATFPGSKFVLTQRPTAMWIKSYENMLASQGGATPEMNAIRRTLYGLPFPNVASQALTQRYERHNRDVIEFFSGRPESLLVVDWSSGDGWEELCSFLGRAVPAAPFPHANKGAYEKKRNTSWLRSLFS